MAEDEFEEHEFQEDFDDRRNERLYDTIHDAVRDALAAEQKRKDGNPVLQAAYFFAGIWLCVAAVNYFSYARWVNKFRYSVWFSIDTSEVNQPEDKPPSDCDFLHAPIGNKGCRYKKEVEVTEPSTANNNKRSVYVYWSREEGDY
jgi:hypothetical protein